jgi:hypothetical protein
VVVIVNRDQKIRTAFRRHQVAHVPAIVGIVGNQLRREADAPQDSLLLVKRRAQNVKSLLP